MVFIEKSLIYPACLSVRWIIIIVKSFLCIFPVLFAVRPYRLIT